ncbi:MAG: toxin-antitoxin system YwqK family antitoxin [Flavobacteriia bacterium]|nr:toxin-antitoxin system YwqK family antitoxin [Flavobacteriia bacterium]
MSWCFSQLEVKKAAPCNQKSIDRKKNSRYAEWECGKLAGAVDCNEKLSYDEGSNTFTSGLDNLPFTGTCETCHNNGLLERRVSFVNGKESGKDTTTYESGCPEVIREHIDGLRHGQWIYYFDTVGSPIQWEMNFFMGEKHGKHVFFTQKGDTINLENYNHGLLEGVKKVYFPQSKLEKEIHYSKGVFNGSYKSYSREGKLLQESNYVLGKKDGEFKYYYNDGVLLKIEHWKLDVKEGEFKVFYYEGNIQTLENYKKGKKEGWFEEYYPNQKIKSRALYKKDIVIEEHKFNEKGQETYTYVLEKGRKKKKTEDDEAPGEKTKKTKKTKDPVESKEK